MLVVTSINKLLIDLLVLGLVLVLHLFQLHPVLGELFGVTSLSFPDLIIPLLVAQISLETLPLQLHLTLLALGVVLCIAFTFGCGASGLLLSGCNRLLFSCFLLLFSRFLLLFSRFLFLVSLFLLPVSFLLPPVSFLLLLRGSLPGSLIFGAGIRLGRFLLRLLFRLLLLLLQPSRCLD